MNIKYQPKSRRQAVTKNILQFSR